MSSETTESSNFLKAQIEADLAAGRYPQLVTRFPPEPNGLLHIGHAKAICVDFGLARTYGGRCHLRFDDTNPTAEDMTFAKAIEDDIRWLGFDWGDHQYHASDYFEQLYKWAVEMVERGEAYVDSCSMEEMRTLRGTVNEPGTHSPWRERPVAENLRILDEMRRGEHPEGSHVLRAKGDMSHANMKMRDPLMYRILQHDHDRTGDAWRIYPMYDYAHGVSDAIEGITHSICTLEFQNNRALYDFFVEKVGFKEPRPHQYEMARLKLPYTVVSKRKLKPLVENDIVTGWDDPRLFTLSGLRARGVPPESIVAFCERIGVSKANSVVDPMLLDNAIRDTLNPTSKRLMAVLDPLPVHITNWSSDTEWTDASLYPHDVPLEGSRQVPFSKTLVIERADFMETPVKGFRRLAPGREVRLRYGYIIQCTGVRKNEAGEVVGIEATYDPETRSGGANNRKVAATLHWVSMEEGARARVIQVGRLFDVADLSTVEDITTAVAEGSLTTVDAWVEPATLQEAPGARVQFERTGYYYLRPDDQVDDGPLVFTRIVEMKSSYKPKAKATKPVSKPKQNRQVASVRERTNDEKAAIVALEARGFPTEEAGLMVDDAGLADTIEAVVAAGASPALAAKWCVHEVKTPVVADVLAELIQLVDAGTITHRIGRDVLAIWYDEGGRPSDIVQARGFEVIGGDDVLASMVDDVLAKHEKEAAAWRGGKDRLQGFFVGQIMKATQGRADARRVNELLAERR